MEKRLFGTDGVRGIANVHPMTTEMAMQLGRAAAFTFKNGKKRHHILIGKDTRLSGYMIENALVAGICSMGVDVKLVGPLPTPGIAFLTNSMRADAQALVDQIREAVEIGFKTPVGRKAQRYDGAGIRSRQN
jgi:phosphoglucosamine mutase